MAGYSKATLLLFASCSSSTLSRSNSALVYSPTALLLLLLFSVSAPFLLAKDMVSQQTSKPRSRSPRPAFILRKTCSCRTKKSSVLAAGIRYLPAQRRNQLSLRILSVQQNKCTSWHVAYSKDTALAFIGEFLKLDDAVC